MAPMTLNAIKAIVNNVSIPANQKKNIIVQRFPNLNYYKLANQAPNANVKKILKNIAATHGKSNLANLLTPENMAAKIKAEKNAKIQAILLKVWGHAGTGGGSESQNYRNRVALPAARANKELMNMMTNNISRANFNAILNNPAFAPPSNNKGGARNRHTQRVKYMLRNLGWKLPTN
jgi:hypothetical protein